MITFTRMNSKEEYVEEIRKAGRYIADHAENLLGEYPSLITGELRITAILGVEAIPTVKIEREHIVVKKKEYDTYVTRWNMNESPQ